MRIFGLLAAMTLVGLLVTVQSSEASAQTPNRDNAPLLRCDAPNEELCLFEQTNYQGDLTFYGDLSREICNDLGEPKRSFRASTEFSGTLYETADCQGRSVAVERGGQNPDIGFVANGWKQAVTCGKPDQLCLFDQPDYEGAANRIEDIGDNNCLNLPASGKQSYQAGDQREGYLYEQSNCQGSPIAAVIRSQENPDIGAVAHSFKQACVSCRRNPN